MSQGTAIGSDLNFGTRTSRCHLRFVGHQRAAFRDRFNFADLSRSRFSLQSLPNCRRQRVKAYLFLDFEDAAIGRDGYILGMAFRHELDLIFNPAVLLLASLSLPHIS